MNNSFLNHRRHTNPPSLHSDSATVAACQPSAGLSVGNVRYATDTAQQWVDDLCAVERCDLGGCVDFFGCMGVLTGRRGTDA